MRSPPCAKLGPTWVNLHLKDATPQQAYAELSRQCGLPIVPKGENLWQRTNQASVTLDLIDEPFWAAMRRVCITFGLRTIVTGGDDEAVKINLIRDTADEMPSPAAFNGSFMMLATRFERRTPSTAPTSPTPRSPPAKPRHHSPPRSPSSPIPSGASSSIPSRLRWNRPATTGETSCRTSTPCGCRCSSRKTQSGSMRTDIRHVPTDCKTLKNVKGSFRIVLLEQAEPLEVLNILTVHNALRKVGEHTVQIKEAVKDGEGYKVRLTIFRNGLSTQEWRRQRESQGVQLLDEKSRPLARGGFNAEENGDQVDYEFNFFKVDPTAQAANAAGDPSKLVIQLPLEPREVTVPFEFKELAIQK